MSPRRLLPVLLCGVLVGAAASQDGEPEAAAAAAPAPPLVLPLLPGAMLRVAVKVNGEPLSLLVDTGASQNVLDATESKRLGIAEGGKLPAMGVGMQMVRLAKIAHFQVGAWEGHDVTFMVMDLSGARAGFGGELHGILGMPFLGEFRAITLDTVARTLTCEPWRPGEDRPASAMEKMVDALRKKVLDGTARVRVPVPPHGLRVAAAPAVVRAQLGLADGVGLCVLELAADSPAARAALEVHDCVTRVGDAAATPRALTEAWAATAPGAGLVLEGRRRGAPFSATLTRPAATERK